MFLKFKKTCVFHGDRSAGEIVEFDVPPRDVSIVIGAGLAEYVDGPHETPETPQKSTKAEYPTIESGEPKTSVKNARKSKKK